MGAISELVWPSRRRRGALPAGGVDVRLSPWACTLDGCWEWPACSQRAVVGLADSPQPTAATLQTKVARRAGMRLQATVPLRVTVPLQATAPLRATVGSGRAVQERRQALAPQVELATPRLMAAAILTANPASTTRFAGGTTAAWWRGLVTTSQRMSGKKDTMHAINHSHALNSGRACAPWLNPIRTPAESRAPTSTSMRRSSVIC